MKDMLYIVMVWLIGVLFAPVLVYLLTGMTRDFFDFYLTLIFLGGMFSLLTEIILIVIYFFLIKPNLKTVFKIKLATNIVVVVLSFLTFLIVFSNLRLLDWDILSLILPYIITMSIAIWGLKLDIEKKEDIPFVDDDVL